MKYKSLKTVVRYLKGKKTTVIKLGETYTQKYVDELPLWYLEDNYLVATE